MVSRDETRSTTARATPDRPHSRKRRAHWHAVAWIVGAVVTLALIVTGLAVRAAAPGWIRHAFEGIVHEHCTECVVHIGSTDVSLIHGRVTFRDVNIADPSPTPRIVIRAREFEINLVPRSLLRPTRRIEHIVLRDAAFYLVQGRPPHREGDRATTHSAMPKIRVDRIDVEGLTVHILAQPSRDIDHAAEIRVDDIRGTIGAFGSRRGVVRALTQVHARARLQGQGALALDSTLDPTRDDVPAHIDLDLRDFDLDRLSPYMRATSDRHVRGRVEHAHAAMVMRGRDVSGTLSADYEHFEVRFDPSAHRAGIVTSALNVGERFFTDRSDHTDGDGHMPSARIEHHRDEGKPIPDFLVDAIMAATARLVQS